MQIISIEDNLHGLSSTRQNDCLWKQRTHYELENGSLGFIESLFSGKNISNCCLLRILANMLNVKEIMLVTFYIFSRRN